MARRLINFCLAWTLVLGCWGGVLAAAVCPHVGCETSAAAAPENAGTHDEHSPGEIHEPAGEADHSAHAETHQGHAADPPAGGSRRPATGELGGLASSSHDASCNHCVGRPGPPPAAKFEWQSGSAKKAEKDSAPPTVGQVPVPSRAHVREVTPSQHAPPGRGDRHLLLSVFRI